MRKVLLAIVVALVLFAGGLAVTQTATTVAQGSVSAVQSDLVVQLTTVKWTPSCDRFLPNSNVSKCWLDYYTYGVWKFYTPGGPNHMFQLHKDCWWVVGDPTGYGFVNCQDGALFRLARGGNNPIRVG